MTWQPNSFSIISKYHGIFKTYIANWTDLLYFGAGPNAIKSTTNNGVHR